MFDRSVAEGVQNAAIFRYFMEGSAQHPHRLALIFGSFASRQMNIRSPIGEWYCDVQEYNEVRKDNWSRPTGRKELN